MEKHGITVRETVDARKTRYAEGDLEDLFDGASKVIAARGKNHVEFNLKKDYDAAELAKRALGPSGNLRAPALRMGKTWLIGFNEEAYADRFA